MKHGYIKSMLSALTILGAAAVITLASATTLRAQIGGQVTTGPGLSGRDRDINNREMEMTNLERQGKSATRDPQMIMAQVNEDFDRLRAIDEEMQTTLSAKAALDYKHVAETSAEVKKRATRLKTNLTFPAGKEEKRQKMEDPGADLTPSLVMLEGLIKSFINNPIFSDTGGLDTQLAGKAKRDLDSIIELSDKLKKSAEKQSKNAGKS